MDINVKLLQFLTDSQKLSNCYILLTDLSEIICVIPDSIKYYYLNKNISNDLKKIINSNLHSDDSFLFNNKIKVIPIVENDTFMYSSQIILPVFFNNQFEGLLIFFVNNRTFLKSNLNYALTTKKFIEKMLDN